MKQACELKKITEEVLRTKKEETLKILDEEIFPKMEQAAKRGNGFYVIGLSYPINYAILKEILITLEYKVYVTNSSMTISWR